MYIYPFNDITYLEKIEKKVVMFGHEFKRTTFKHVIFEPEYLDIRIYKNVTKT